MAVVTCWALLLLTILPLRTIAGRHIPAGPPLSASQMQSAPSLQVPAAPLSRHESRALGTVVLPGDGTQFQDRSPPPPPDRKMMRRRRLQKNLKSTMPVNSEKSSKKSSGGSTSIYGHERLLVGSSPPTCQGKCGACFPCSPIHISIGSPRGALTQQEYYPEVWRCKCGSRYFMP